MITLRTSGVDCDCVMNEELPAAGEGRLVGHRRGPSTRDLRSVQRIVGEPDSRAEPAPYDGRRASPRGVGTPTSTGRQGRRTHRLPAAADVEVDDLAAPRGRA